MSVIVELRNVWKSFNSINALQDTNLTIIQGKITSVLGPSGSGKTTLLRIISGLDTPTRGTVLYGNNIITSKELATLRQNATLVFQKSVFFDTTVYDNIAYGLKLKGDISKEEIKSRVNFILELLHLENFEKRRAKKLSGGEQQRVSLARALVLDRELLLLDEPTVNLDPKNVSIIEETIQRVNREKKKTIVLATHNMYQAEALSQNVVLILAGKIKQTGIKQRIFNESNKHLMSFSRLENVFSGDSKINEDGTATIQVDDNLRIDTTICRTGKLSVNVRPEDIIVSIEPLNSSARNVFRGTIIGIKDLGNIVRLSVDAEKKFSVQITKKSLTKMNLNVGSEVYLTFKASSVRTI